MKTVIIFFQDLFYGIADLSMRQLKKLITLFLKSNRFEQGIVIFTFAGFAAVIMSVGRYYIFETWFLINNPLAVYMIAIIGFMLITVYFQHRILIVGRIVINIYYLIWVLIIHFGTGIIKAPYDITAGYYVNIAVPVLYTALALLSAIKENIFHRRSW